MLRLTDHNMNKNQVSNKVSCCKLQMKLLEKHQLVFCGCSKIGLVRDLNPGPLAPKARIIPLDQRAAQCEEAK